jgi:hypothetical protein
MHSWMTFFDLLGLPREWALGAYAITALIILTTALRCWLARGPLTLRYSVLLIATALVDPHMYAYDLVLLLPAFLQLWDWALAEGDRPLGEIVPRLRLSGLRHRAFSGLFQSILYVCYFSPLFADLARVARLQISVLVLSLLGLIVAGALLPGRTPATAEASMAVRDELRSF